MSSALIEQILGDPWVQEQRAAGKAIMALGKNGRIYHADPQVKSWLGRDELGGNAFDLVPPEMAALGAQALAQYRDLEAYTIWFPMIHADHTQHWYRWDGRRMNGLMVDAVAPEEDPDLHHVHVVAR